ncbi:hypothetical protein MtrunA17_Chr2g0291671 [Medicago truncatula]|uniref:Uncharacterized protein n=1 Tax=Medicago truncatula TaxID=3880 RepID=A0A396J421_MEDTR|nr:hypothetical protein MtrunA17_Chr2g0291671 [Medicago truncatula]
MPFKYIRHYKITCCMLYLKTCDKLFWVSWFYKISHPMLLAPA